MMQVRICTRLGVQLVSTDFNNKDYYANIRKAMVAGYFMQVCQLVPCMLVNKALAQTLGTCSHLKTM